MRNIAIGVTVAALAAVAPPLAAPANAAEQPRSAVTIIHGVPGVTVDVRVNGDTVLDDLAPLTQAGPLSLTPGDYRIEVLDQRGEAVIDETVAVPSGEDVSVVASYVALGQLGLQTFVNDTSPVPAGTTRYVLRNTAVTPGRASSVFFTPETFRGTTQTSPGGESNTIELASSSGTYDVFTGYGATLGGGTAVTIGSLSLDAPSPQASQSYVGYVVGQATQGRGSLAFIVQKINVRPTPGPTPPVDTSVPIPVGGPGQARVTVVHGVPGLAVDVYVDGRLTLEDFEPGTVTDEVTLPARPTRVALVAANGDLSDAVVQTTASLPEKSNVSLVASLLPDGTPGLRVFVNDTTKLAAGTTRYLARNVAVTPQKASSLIITAESFRGTTQIAPGETSNTIERPSAEVPFTIAAGYGSTVGGGTQVQFEAGLRLEPVNRNGSQSFIAYFIGSADDRSLDVVYQKLGGPGRTFSIVSPQVSGQEALAGARS